MLDNEHLISECYHRRSHLIFCSESQRLVIFSYTRCLESMCIPFFYFTANVFLILTLLDLKSDTVKSAGEQLSCESCRKLSKAAWAGLLSLSRSENVCLTNSTRVGVVCVLASNCHVNHAGNHCYSEKGSK